MVWPKMSWATRLVAHIVAVCLRQLKTMLALKRCRSTISSKASQVK